MPAPSSATRRRPVPLLLDADDERPRAMLAACRADGRRLDPVIERIATPDARAVLSVSQDPSIDRQFAAHDRQHGFLAVAPTKSRTDRCSGSTIVRSGSVQIVLMPCSNESTTSPISSPSTCSADCGDELRVDGSRLGDVRELRDRSRGRIHEAAALRHPETHLPRPLGNEARRDFSASQTPSGKCGSSSCANASAALSCALASGVVLLSDELALPDTTSRNRSAIGVGSASSFERPSACARSRTWNSSRMRKSSSATGLGIGFKSLCSGATTSSIACPMLDRSSRPRVGTYSFSVQAPREVLYTLPRAPVPWFLLELQEVAGDLSQISRLPARSPR